MSTQANNVTQAIAAKLLSVADVINRRDLSSCSLNVNLDRNGVPHVLFRAEFREQRDAGR